MRIGVDARLGITRVSSGLGRVTRNLIEGFAEYDRENEYVLLIQSGQTLRAVTPARTKIIETTYGLFTADDYFLTPAMVKDERLDVFLSPQFYLPTQFHCPEVKIIHDLWASLHPEWLPVRDDFVRDFGESGYAGVAEVTKFFLGLYRKGLIFPQNSFLRNAVARLDVHSLQLGAIARMAMSLHFASGVVTVSHFVSKQITQYFPEAKSKLNVIYNFVSPSLLKPSRRLEGNFVLHVSKWEPRKNIELAINGSNVARKVSGASCPLVLAGNDFYSTPYREKILNIISQDDNDNHFSNIGTVDDTRLESLYRNAVALISPSFNEGFGLPALEAMSCGTPVISSNVTSLPEICGDGAIYVSPNDANAVALAINRLSNNSELRHEVGMRAHARSLFFDRAEIVKAFLSLLQETALTGSSSGDSKGSESAA